MENSTEEITWYRQLLPLYYFKQTRRNHILDLFPMPYIANKSEVDENKIYEYVYEYLKALKVMLAEPDFQKLLYDPEYWVYANPYK